MTGERYTIEIQPEDRLWLENLPAHHYVIAEQKVDRLAENATTLGEPCTAISAAKSVSCASTSAATPSASPTGWLLTAVSYC